MEKDERPWGNYQVLLDDKACKVKKITVYPKKRLSLQRHKYRREHWYMLGDGAKVVLDQKELLLEAHQSVDIPLGAIHRIENTGEENLQFIETQTGSYFGEDDIERFEDDFGRAPE
jgi:mannose-6-phosphate isomerase-like protein (cupin superfamily)